MTDEIAGLENWTAPEEKPSVLDWYLVCHFQSCIFLLHFPSPPSHSSSPAFAEADDPSDGCGSSLGAN